MDLYTHCSMDYRRVGRLDDGTHGCGKLDHRLILEEFVHLKASAIFLRSTSEYINIVLVKLQHFSFYIFRESFVRCARKEEEEEHRNRI